MTHVYTFHVELVDFEKVMWRDMEVSENYTVAQLGYANMASFEGNACHKLATVGYQPDVWKGWS